MVQKRKKRKSKGVIKERKEKVLSAMRDLGGQVYTQLNKKEFPTFRMPSRSIANILYDSKTRQYILGKRTVKRSARNVRHLRPFTQLLWTAMFADELTEQLREGAEVPYVAGAPLDRSLSEYVLSCLGVVEYVGDGSARHAEGWKFFPVE